MKFMSKKVFLIVIIIAVLISCCLLFYKSKKTTVIKFAFFSENAFDSVTEKNYRIIDEAIKAYEQDNENIRIEYTTGILKEDYLDYINNCILKNDMPDVLLILSSDIYKYIELGMLEKLDDYVCDLDQYYQCGIDSATYKKELYGLPFEINPNVMVRNKNILKDIEVDFEWTTSDLYDLMNEIEYDNHSLICNYTWQNATDAFTDKLFDEDGEEAFFDDGRVVDAIDYVYKLNISSNNNILGKEDFENGYVAYTPMKYSEYVLYKKYPYNIANYIDFEVACTSMPKYGDNATISIVDSVLLSMSKFSKNKKKAFDFISYLSCDEQVQTSIFRYSNAVSPIKSVVNSRRVLDILNELCNDQDVENDIAVIDYMLINSKAKPMFKEYDEIMSYSDSKITDAIVDIKDIDIFNKVLNNEIEELMKN